MLLDSAIDRLYDLHPGTTPVEEGSSHERPHKPLLLLAALDLIDEGLATPEHIPWCQELRDRFSARFLFARIKCEIFSMTSTSNSPLNADF